MKIEQRFEKPASPDNRLDEIDTLIEVPARAVGGSWGDMSWWYLNNRLSFLGK